MPLEGEIWKNIHKTAALPVTTIEALAGCRACWYH